MFKFQKQIKPIQYLIIALFWLSINVNAQTFQDDSLAVRAILDTNGLSSITVDSVTYTSYSTGRIYYLKLAGLAADTRNIPGEIRVLPAEIGNLTELTWLELPGNSLTSLPPEIGNLTKLENLYLDNNLLTTIPAEIGSLTALTWLRLDNNILDSIPAEIGNLINLDVISLSYNNMISCSVPRLIRT